MTEPTQDMPEDLPQPLRRHRALFMSDLHLGARGCRADEILDFLTANDAETLYLIGDVLDIWHPISAHWTETHDRILSLVLSRAQAGMRIFYLVGNHDRAMRRYPRARNRGIEIAERTVHQTASGEEFLVLHGDICDARLLRWHLFTRIGTKADHILRGFDTWLKKRRSSARDGERSLIESALGWVNAILAHGTRYEVRLTELARRGGHTGVICGHFHKPQIHDRHGLIYANCGDWLDSFTAIAEDPDGSLRLIRWTEERAALPHRGRREGEVTDMPVTGGWARP
jgi:UDP-2,3-diacylglucosamine pyrophosphatase LpxH